MDSKVVDSRMIEEGTIIRRRRECERCWHRFSTFERIGITELVVIKKDGTKIWDDILAALKTIDPVVYVRFASVYQSFDGFEDFKHFIE